MVDTTVVKVYVLFFTGEDVHQVKAGHVLVFQVLQLVTEHGAAGGLVAVEQGDLALGLGFQGGLHDREDRSNTTAGRNGQVIAFTFRVQINGEMALRRHDFQSLAGLELLVGKGGEATARNLFDGDAKLLVVDTAADRVGAANFLAIQLGAHDQVLALLVVKLVCQIFRHVKSK